MTRPEQTELMLIRHAPACHGGRLAGRRDVPADCTDSVAFTALRSSIGPVDARLSSPALRCVQTAAALWHGLPATETDPRLWEQDFGDWEGLAFEEQPDLGPLPAAALAAHRPPHGESFEDLCARVAPALFALARRGGRIGVVAHAGTIRAALALALGSAGAGLAFQIEPLSVTRLATRDGRAWSIGAVNGTPREPRS